jgi:Kef-type K+ transport system membrane component KefB
MGFRNISDVHPLSKWIFLPFYSFSRRKLRFSQASALISTNVLSGVLHGLLVLFFKDVKQALAVGIIFTVISIGLSYFLLKSKRQKKGQSFTY